MNGILLRYSSCRIEEKSGSCAITVYGIRNALQKDKSIVLRAMDQAVFVV